MPRGKSRTQYVNPAEEEVKARRTTERLLSSMQKKVALITVSDLHFSHDAPKARAEKGDGWYGVMAYQCTQLHNLKAKHDGAEIVYAGDIFNTWREPIELVNRIIDWLPRGYGIPGQHDLPHHRYEDKLRTPYWTLVRAGVIEDLPPNAAIKASDKVVLFGFPWGSNIISLWDHEKKHGPSFDTHKELHVAVCHSYIWLGPNKYKDAPNEQHFSKYLPKLEGYDVAVFGDNHKSFCNTIALDARRTSSRSISIINNGYFIPRNADESLQPPMVGLVYEDGSVEQAPLDTSQDQWLDEEEQKVDSVDPDLDELMDLLKRTRHKEDFAKVLVKGMEWKQLTRLAQLVIAKALEDSK
jgi:hypothetical protein